MAKQDASRRPIRLPQAVEQALDNAPWSGDIIMRWATAVGVALLMAAVTGLVWLTGGTQAAYLHLIYIPILLAASSFGVVGGVVAAVIAGVGVVGPLMPLDTSTGEMQPLGSWLFRLGVFLAFGVAAGIVIGRLRDQLRRIQSASLLHPNSGLPTQLALEQVIGRLLEDGNDGAPYRLLLVDVRNYDQVFNTLGPEITQSLPGAVARELRGTFPADWQIYHVHAGKIAVLAHEKDDSAAAHARAITALLGQPLEVAGVPVYLDIIVGIASLRELSSGASGALRRANIALDGARRGGQLVGYYEDYRDRGKKNRLQILSDTPRALEENQLQLVYQPQIRLADNRVIGAEALIRWQHPTLGLLPPGRFIPLLEETDLINRLTIWVAQSVVRQAAEWQRAGLTLQVAFNASPRNMEDATLARTLLESIEQQEVQPDRIELELTESAIIRDTGMVKRLLEDLKIAGLGVALDDFGAGYTSVRHLTALPIDKLKIDRSLIDRVTSEPRRMRIVAAITHLAHDLGMRTVAEGIEDAETLAYLQDQHCDIAQGYYYSKPVPPDELVHQYREMAAAAP